ncbi:MAG: PEP/pyruvate-binding domain-containing protein [Kofleriaceae bacterium]
MHDICELREATADFGGKAAGLARLIAAGLPVPAGFAIAARVFARFAAGEAVELDLNDHLRELGPILAVRSSAAVEDGAAGSAAGIFRSVVRVAVADVEAAIREVWSSALTPHAVAYASERTHEVAVGVIVQRFIEGERLTVYTRPLSGESDDLLIQRGEQLTRVPRSQVPAELPNHHAVVQALRAERAIGGPADVELVQVMQRDDVLETWVVQARPIVIREARRLSPPPPIVLAPLRDGRTWTWDVTHNPDPLSPAQAQLVAIVERLQLGAYELRVCAGYLYSTPRARSHPGFGADLSAALVSTCREMEARIELLLAARTSYHVVYHVWADELAPRIAELRSRVAKTHAQRPSSIEATLAAAARGTIDFAEVVRRIGAMSPTWDVAVPTFGERPELLHRAIAVSNGAPPSTEITSENIDLEAIVADLAERDDLLFARMQLDARNALLAAADARGIDRDDIFWLDPGDYDLEIETIRRKASAARAANDRAHQWQMPLVVGGPTSTPPTTELRGVGHGPRVVGRVVRFASLASSMFASAGDVVVVRAVTPALAVFVGKCAALVSETGGLLDHGAALARELGITCVVGCANAWTLLADGELITVDGEAGTIERNR